MRELRTSLKELRMEAGFTQSELAEIVGNCRDNISRLERNNCTLSELIDRINPLGVKFGIWIEPEMVNEDSDLYRNHSDWVIKIENRNPIRSRSQLRLDFSRKEVRDYIFEQICKILDQGNIEYIKWDMNRSMSDVYAGNVTYDYVIGYMIFWKS